VLDQLVWERTKELQESENKYRTLYECVGDAIIIHDDKANIMEVNPEACIRYGYSREEFIKMNVNEIDSPEQVENIPKRINTLFETGSVSFESVHLDKAGNQINVEINSRITEYGGKKAMISICRDITLRKKALEQIKVSLEEKEVLLQEIHHRVKNNMQIISGLLGLQMRSTNDKNANEALLDSQLRVQAMSYVHEILYSSENLSLIKMRTYLLCLTDTLTRSFGIAPAKVKTVVDVGELNLNIDQATPLGLIVNELVCNALKHAFPDDKEGKIIIKTQTDSQEGIRLTVSDNGIGIPDTLNWQKTDSLGLSLVRLLALRQLDGSIEMRQDHGTTFIVTFKQKK
ncbi:PAS domain S-box protein, partial [bacterium]|nr:PAS domain S-box protein [bacterium]